MDNEPSLISPISAKSLGGSSTIQTPPSETAPPPPQEQQQQQQPPTTTKNSNSNMTTTAGRTTTSNASATVTPVNPNSSPSGNVSNKNKSGGSNNTPQPQQNIEYNPRWKGYMYIFLSSLINFASICNIPKSHHNNNINNNTNNYFDTDDFDSNFDINSAFDIVNGTRGVALSFSIVTFVYSGLIILMDRLQICSTKFHYMNKSYNGCIAEGMSLCVGTVYSVIAVAYITQVRGIAYLTLNIYFSVWLILISFIYTLNKWSTAKDILSIAELTGISTTLKSWYMIFISSLVVTGTSMNMLVVLSIYDESTQIDENESARATTLGIVFGLCSTIISVWMILSHYNFIECTNEGGWFELLLIIVIILIWIIATAVMTTNNSIAATITGSGCYYYAPLVNIISPTSAPSAPDDDNSTTLQNILNLIQDATRLANQTNDTLSCFLSIQNITYSCDSFAIDDDDDVGDDTVINGKSNVTETAMSDVKSLEAIPGSNLYIFLWINLLTSFHLVSRWKAQQALQFAHTQQKQQQLKATATTGNTPQLLTTTTKNNNNSNKFRGGDVEKDDVEHDNDNDGSDAGIDDFDDDDRY